jgi:hypothetical protein
MRDLVLRAYDGATTIDVLTKPVGKLRPVRSVRRPARNGKAVGAGSG